MNGIALENFLATLANIWLFRYIKAARGSLFKENRVFFYSEIFGIMGRL